MRRTLLTTAIAATVTCATAFAAATPDTFMATAKAPSGGSKKKPKAVGASFVFSVTGPAGSRSITPASLGWKWDGIIANGKKFPKCTAATIDGAQSDAGCPKGSLVGSGTVSAVLGPETDRTQGINCEKQVRIYNAGSAAEVLYLYGDPSVCAGVGYLPPNAMTVKHTGSGDQFTLVLPDNIAHPLPGLEGVISKFSISYKKMSIGKGKKAVPYLTSVGCGTSKKRNFSFTQTYADYDDGVATVPAGDC